MMPTHPTTRKKQHFENVAAWTKSPGRCGRIELEAVAVELTSAQSDLLKRDRVEQCHWPAVINCPGMFSFCAVSTLLPRWARNWEAATARARNPVLNT